MWLWNKVVFFAQMKIGKIDLGFRPVMLAPMEDVTDVSFKVLCRKMGAAMVYSEFVSSDALVRMVNKSLAKLEIHEEERPVAIQIYGKEPEAVADAAKIVVEQAHPDVLDINFGCPVKKVAGKGAGAGLLRNVPLMLEITRAVVNAVSIPVTAKTRLGWDHDSIIIEQLAEQLQDCGISALIIHGRTRSQVYNGEADWEPIRRVKANPRISIPIIGNGDITSGEEARRRFEETGVDAVMVGRATFGKPWIFAEINRALGKETGISAPGCHRFRSRTVVARLETRCAHERSAPKRGKKRKRGRINPHAPPHSGFTAFQRHSRLQGNAHCHVALREYRRDA